MPAVLIIQNSKIEGPGYLGDLLRDDGFEITGIDARHERLPDEKFQMVIILGAPESANDDLMYLRAEQNLIRECVTADIPVLGICLGSQLIAKALGAGVYCGPKKEIGVYGDLKSMGSSLLFSGIESPFTVFHWHGDTFDLPKGAVRLASSKHYENQAFQYGSAVGLQFHMEVNEEMVNLWLDGIGENREMSHAELDRIRSDACNSIPIIQSNMRIFYRNYMSLFGI